MAARSALDAERPCGAFASNLRTLPTTSERSNVRVASIRRLLSVWLRKSRPVAHGRWPTGNDCLYGKADAKGLQRPNNTNTTVTHLLIRRVRQVMIVVVARLVF